MNSVPKILEKVIKKYPDFEYYNLHLDKIENNIDKNPDISIEACKSLIEGISKSILNRIDNTFDEKKETSGRNAKTVQQLFKRALEKIAENNIKFEPGFVHSSGQIINVTSEIRTERGDISHGKSVPKKFNSTPSFARLIANMTDLTISYVLEHFIEIDLDYRENLDYNSKEIKSYNDWLDENIEGFPIKKAKYSQLLYENDYDEYENMYYSDYLRGNDLESDETNIESGKTFVKRTRKYKPGEPGVQLTTTFNPDIFWSENRLIKVSDFAKQHDLNEKGIIGLVEDFVAFDIVPMRNDIFEALNKKPSLIDKNRSIIADSLVNLIVSLANELKKL